MNPKIGLLTIENFRGFRNLRIDGLGRVNLITGCNNTGKSSVLEALRILASNASPLVLHDIMRYREEDIEDTEEQTRPSSAESLFQFSNLFHGFPKLSDKPQSINIEANSEKSVLKLTLEVTWVSEKRDQDGTRRIIYPQQNLFDDIDATPALVIHIGQTKRILPLIHYRRTAYRGRIFPGDDSDIPVLPCFFVSPYGGKHTTSLGVLWDNIALSQKEKDVIRALKIIDPKIEAVSMVGGEGLRRQRAAIVRAEHLPRPVALRTFGDGLNQLFGIVLSLVNASDGLLLIDEFENGMHHTVQFDVWRVIFKLAQSLNIQVFATSHSWDAIEAFQKAAAESKEEGVLIRLSRKGEDIFPTIFAEKELAIATRDRIEVR